MPLTNTIFGFPPHFPISLQQALVYRTALEVAAQVRQPEKPFILIEQRERLAQGVAATRQR